jgi:nitric oxide reductase activation protein
MEAEVAEDGEGDVPDIDAALAARARARAARAARTATARSFLYDEWDCHHAAWLKDWCRVHETRLAGGDAALVHAARREHAPLARQVRRQFAMIRPESWRRVHRASEGDSFDLDRVVEAAIDRRAGIVGDDFLYVRRERALREVAAAFLVDMSASTDFPVPDPAAPAPLEVPLSAEDLYLWGRDGAPVEVVPPARRRRVIDVERDALVLMCDALRALGDSHAVYGFSGSGRDNVEFHIAKDFGDAPGARTMGALAAMAPRRSTRMGPAVRHASAKLKRQPQRRRVLIVISDGYPEDIDYGPDRRDRGYGIEDTASALREAEGAGIATFCITVDRAGHDYLRRMCAEERYLVIDEVAALPQALSKVYRALTA